MCICFKTKVMRVSHFYEFYSNSKRLRVLQILNSEIESDCKICETDSDRKWLGFVIVISILLKRYLKAKRTWAPAYSRALRRIKGSFQRGVKRSSGPVSRIPGEDRVAVKVGVDEMGRVNDQMDQGRSV